MFLSKEKYITKNYDICELQQLYKFHSSWLQVMTVIYITSKHSTLIGFCFINLIRLTMVPFIYFYWIAYSNIYYNFLACHIFCWKCTNLSIYFSIFSKLVLLCTTAAARECVINYSLIKVTFILVSKIISKKYKELWFSLLCVYIGETWFIIVEEERFMVLAQKVTN